MHHAADGRTDAGCDPLGISADNGTSNNIGNATLDPEVAVNFTDSLERSSFH